MASVFTREEIRKKIIRFIPWLLIIWVIYVGYSIFSKYMINDFNRNPETSVFRFSFLRFMIRELVVYSFAFLTYLFLKREGFDRSFYIQMLVALALLDIVCLLLGVLRGVFGDIEQLYLLYNYLIVIIASPIYVICFVIYSMYFSTVDQAEVTD